MTCTLVRNNRLACAVHSAALLVAAAALDGFCPSAAAHEPAPAPRVKVVAPDRALADLEKAFWICDHAATVQGIIDAGIAMPCGVATERLRLDKFSGDFPAMLDWWQQNKAREHRALDETRQAAQHR
jgi:hypothetical protein